MDKKINKLEKVFEKWYDSRKGMPPASFESWLAGYQAKEKEAEKAK